MTAFIDMELVSRRMRRTDNDYWFWCPGCKTYHGVPRDGRWSFDGNLERPTFAPSVRHSSTNREGTPFTKCHYFIRAGQIQFCDDCPHALKGQTIEMPELPDLN